MYEDEIMTELRAARDEYARQHDYDLKDIFADLRKRQDQRTDRKILPTRPHQSASGSQSTKQSA